MKVNLAVLADYASVTREGKLVIAGIFNVVNAPRLPWVQPAMTLVFTLNVSSEEEGVHAVAVRSFDPDGQEFASRFEAQVEAANVDFLDGASLNFLLGLNALALSKYGRHRFDLFVDDGYVESIAFMVKPTAGSEGPS